MKSRTRPPTEPDLNHPDAHLVSRMLPELILNIANRQHGGPFPADFARRGMLLGTLWDVFSFSIWYFTRGVNTSFQCCDQVLPLSQQLTITFGGWSCSDCPNEASKKGISLPFLNYVSYKLH